jgi:Protein of unknown function (DUF3570)
MCARALAAAMAAVAAVVAAIKIAPMRELARILALLFATGSMASLAAVLPEERADAMYHRYDGGGVKVDGPSVLVRKNFAEKVSVNANYYIDHVSSASIDVVTQASPMGYTEKRKQASIGVDYLYDRTLMSANYIQSSESDYRAKTYTLDISQDFFGDLTTLSGGFSYGKDSIRKNGDGSFKESAERFQYRIGLSQIVTPKLLVAFSWENVADDGYLKSPYRSDYFLDAAAGQRIASEDAYPGTHDSDAYAVRALYYLPYRAALKAEYKHYTDDWDIAANSVDIGYTHPLKGGWTLDLHARYYKQSNAYFYYDLLPFADAFKFHARDKELSTFDSKTVGIAVSYEFTQLPFGGRSLGFADKGSINLAWDRVKFSYDDFRDVRVATAPGTEPLYSFQADVIRVYLSMWY